MLRRAARWLRLPALLAVVAGVGLAGSLQPDAAAGRAAGVASVHAVTPLLSARRLPELAAEPAAQRSLAAAVDAFAAALPETACLEVGLDGERVAARAADLALVPASNQKLLVALTALDVLGPSFRYRTTVRAAAAPADGVVAGDLVLVGGGDPQLAREEYAELYRRRPLRTPVEALADQLVAAGVRRVEGDVVGDESRYDRVRVVETWPSRYVADRQVGPLSALTVDDGFVEAEAGAYLPADDPAAAAAGVLRLLLEDRGVEVVGGARSGAAPAGAVELAAVESAPLPEVLGHLLRESDNGTAELLVKEIGRATGGDGSTGGGLAAVEQHLRQRGLPVDGVVLRDGSGLDPANLVSCSLLAEVLEEAGLESPLGQGLAVAGESGTLTSRLRETAAAGRLRAKTGSINDVSSLSGFVPAPDGRTVSFAFILNGPTVDEDAGRLQEELASLLASYPQRPPVEDLDPERPTP